MNTATPLLIGVRATLLTPMAYHGLMVQGGSATVADVLSDTALVFALAGTLGWLPAGPALPVEADYGRDLRAAPFRASLLTPAVDAPAPVLMPPQACKLNIDIECGRPARLAGVVGSGNVKDYFSIQAVAPGAVYEGCLVAQANPFDAAIRAAGRRQLVVRMGLGRQGIVRLEEIPPPEHVRLNAHTGALFSREVGCERYYLHTLQASARMTSDAAQAELAAWI